MFHDDVVGDGQAEAGTLARLLGGEEGFKDVLQGERKRNSLNREDLSSRG